MDEIAVNEIKSVRMDGNSSVLISFHRPEVAEAFKLFIQSISGLTDDMTINENTLSISLIRSGGFVDQVIGVRATHLPTGLSFDSYERSQHRSQRAAIDGLQELIDAKESKVS